MPKQFYTPQSNNMKAQREEKIQLPLFKSLLNVFIQPKTVFLALKDHAHSFWLPSLLVLTANFVFLYLYFDSVSALDYLSELMSAHPDLNENRNFDVLLFNFEFAKYLFIGLYSLLLVCMLVLGAWVLNIASNILTYKNIGYMTWLACVSWAYLPLVFVSLIQIILFYAMGANQTYISMDALAAPNLNTVLFHLNDSDFGVGLLVQLNPIYIGALGLSAIGFKQLTQVSWGKCLMPILMLVLVNYALTAVFG